MIPEIDLGPVAIQTFGLMFALAFVTSGVVVYARLREIGRPPDWAYEITFAALVGGVVGAKLWFAAETDSWDVAGLFSGTGLTWYGGLIGGSLAVLGYARWRGFLGLALLDLVAPALAAGYAVGRIGCQLSGDGDYGSPTGMFWGMSYEDGTVPTPPGVEVHPTPIFEMLAMGFVALLLWRLRDRVRTGALFATYLVLSGAERFLIEFIRRNDDVFAGLTLAQLVGVTLVIAGAAWLLVVSRRDRRPTAAGDRAAIADAGAPR